MIIPEARKVLQWNHWLLGFLGLWPFEINNAKFIFFFIYIMIWCCLQYADLIEYISDLNHVVENLTETIVFNMIAFKIVICRINSRQLRQLIQSIEKDYSKSLYNTTNELAMFLEYNLLSKNIVQWCSILSIFSSMLFYSQPFMSHLLTYFDSTGNSSSAFLLPCHIRLFFNMTEERTYYIIYACEILIVPTCTCGYLGPSCLLITLVLHICGQMSVLSSRVKTMMNDPITLHQQLKQIVIKHHRLLRLFANVQSVYSTLLLQELFGITMLTCLGSYNVITTSVVEDSTNFLKVLIYILSIISQLFGFCYIGECIVTESTNLCDAFYDCEWNNVPPDHAKLLLLCIVRSQRPIVLTAGKFFTFSLESFTSVLKTSMAYLSVLRNFI